MPSGRRGTLLHPRDLRGSVIVITGASSGLGRATALLAADAGAHLVLVARTDASLRSVAGDCELRGAMVVPVVADVADPADVDRVLTAAVEHFGVIDTWVNAAGVLLVGELGSEDVAEIDRLLATNVNGAAFGSRAAMLRFREQGHGVLINVSSLLGVVPNVNTPVYTMSKFAVRGLSSALHHAVGRRSRIRVCVLLPGPIDTPMFQQAANHTGRSLRAIPPAASVNRLAAGVLRCARRPRSQFTVGISARAILVAHWLLPRPTEWAVAHAAARLLVRRASAPPSPGTLFTGSTSRAASGGWRRGAWRRRAGDAAGRLVARAL